MQQVGEELQGTVVVVNQFVIIKIHHPDNQALLTTGIVLRKRLDKKFHTGVTRISVPILWDFLGGEKDDVRGQPRERRAPNR